jgi:hypothetical protein
MADPITLAAAGAVGGALLKPKNPLQGAMLGGMAGFTGGTALGVGGATTAAGGGTGLTMGAGGTGLTAGGAGLSPTGGVLGTTGLTGTGTTGLTIPQVSSLAATQSPMTASLAERLSMAGKSAYENPMMTASALNATQGLLTPEQMPSPAPAMPLQAGRGVKPYDPMASLDPYRQSVVGGQPISLI